jgi:hypothetical protein
MTKLSIILLGAMLATGLVLVLLQHQAQVRLRGEIQIFQDTVDQLPSLLAENQRLSNSIAISLDASSNYFRELAELSRLRTKADAQKHQIHELQDKLAVQSTTPSFQSLAGSNRFVNLTKAEWKFAGYSTPEAALQTMLWATQQGDVDTLRASLTPAEIARRQNGAWQGKSDSEIADAGVQELAPADGIQILNIQMPSEDDAHFTVYISGFAQPNQPLWFDLKRLDGEWKSDGSEYRLPGP